MVTQTLIPEAIKRRLARAVDIFIEREAFTLEDARRVFSCARDHGLAVKAHVDQFHAIGGVELAIEHGAISVDHLEASGKPQIMALGLAPTIGVLLPGVTLHLGIPAAPGRALIDAGAAVAVGTDCNPGSSPLFSPQLAMALAVRLNGLTPAEALTACAANVLESIRRTPGVGEAILFGTEYSMRLWLKPDRLTAFGLTPAEALTACTANGAAALQREGVGRLRVGMCADFLVVGSADWRDLPYTLGGSPIERMILGGREFHA